MYAFYATMKKSEKRGKNMDKGKDIDTKNEYLSVRIEPMLKKDFYEFCNKCGISASAAVNQLALKTIERGSIPFTIHVIDYDIKKNGDTKRISIRMKTELRKGFSEVCTKIGIPMSTVVKIFMLQCIDEGKFPFDFK